MWYAANMAAEGRGIVYVHVRASEALDEGGRFQDGLAHLADALKVPALPSKIADHLVQMETRLRPSR